MLKKIDLQVINQSTTNLLSAHIILIVINGAKYFQFVSLFQGTQYLTLLEIPPTLKKVCVGLKIVFKIWMVLQVRVKNNVQEDIKSSKKNFKRGGDLQFLATLVTLYCQLLKGQ